MILDASYQFDPPATSVAIAAGTQVSTNIIDLHALGMIPVLASGQGARDMGIGDDPALKFVVQVGTAFASAGSTGTISAAIQGATDDGTGAPLTWVTYLTGPVAVIPVAGARLLQCDMPRPPAGIAFPRFLRLLYTVAVQTMTAGTVQSYLVLDRDDQVMLKAATNSGYPAGINVAN